MKRFIVTIMTTCVVILSGCSNDQPAPAKTYSGKVWIDCMSAGTSTTTAGQSVSAKSASLEGASLVSAVTSSLSNPVSTITTTFQGSDISISLYGSADMQGAITNDTPDTIMGLWYFPLTMPIDGNPNFVEAYWGGDIITLQPGETFQFYGGVGLSETATWKAVPGPVIWTAYFFDTTGEANVPTVWHDGIDAVLAYGATHTPRAVGSVILNFVP